MYICICNAVTERDIDQCMARGACSIEQLQCELGVAAGCGCCRAEAEAKLRNGKPRAESRSASLQAT